MKHSHSRNAGLTALGSLFIAIALLTGCAKARSSQTPEPKAAARDPLSITVPASLRERIKTGKPRVAAVAGMMDVAGRIEANEMRLARVSSPVTGRITDLRVAEGEIVHRGQVLASLYSLDLSQQQFGLLKAASAKQLAERAVARAKQLLTAEVIGSAELQRREAELQQASAELASARDQLRVLGMSPESIARIEAGHGVDSQAQIIASGNGTVMERKVTVGQLVQPAEPAFVISDLEQLWLIADIPEQNAGGLRAGEEVQAEVAAFPGEIIRGKLSFVSAVVNPETRTVRARMDLPNHAHRYKPEMLANIRLRDGAKRQTLIPDNAVVREDNQDHVFVQTGTDTYALRTVTLGDEFDGRRVVVSGLQPGEEIVLDGAFHLNNERRRILTQGAAD
ncbi:MAG TPA: efflux RND transporter periplasmic adaptor subunit [Bryobacteraceae bacterium]|nr:efflux RND transporter periplasmic adaptor subunit [Bryobacteraceae bacterium]